jgi:streptogramin lyase
VATGEGGVWVIDFWHGTVTRVDPATTRVVATIRLRLPFPVCQSCPDARDFLPFDLTTGAGAVWVITDRGAVARIDPQTNRVAAYVRVSGENGGGIAVVGNRVWVSNGVMGVWAIDPATNSVVLKGHFVHGSHRVAAGSLAAADGELWAAGANVRRTGDPANPWAFAKGGGAARIDPATGHLLTTFDFDRPANITAVGEGAVWVDAGADRFFRIDTRTYAVTGPFSFGGTLWAVADDVGWVVTAGGGVKRVPLP